MAQLLQSIYGVAPYIILMLCIGATVGGIWLLLQLRRRNSHSSTYLSDRLFFKRNANRLRKMQLH